MSAPTTLHVVPLTLKKANEFVASIHLHHGAMPGGLDYFRIGAVDESGALVGVAIIARPPNRNSDDGVTGEVVRLATDGTKNAGSFLYGACADICRRMGFARLITYTLESESGASLRGCGWVQTRSGIRSWWQSHQVPGRTVKAREHYAERKLRWEAPLFANAPTVGHNANAAVAGSPQGASRPKA